MEGRKGETKERGRSVEGKRNEGQRRKRWSR